LLSQLEIIKQLKPHLHVIKLLGCVTESGKFWTKTIKETVFSLEISLDSILLGFFLFLSQLNEVTNALHLQHTTRNLSIQLLYSSENYGHHRFFIVVHVRSDRCLTSPVSIFYLVFFSESLLVLIEYVPFGDLLGYLRKSRGLNDTYYKDPDIKPKTRLTSQQLIKFSWQIADGMSYLSWKRVRNVLGHWTFIFCALIGLLRNGALWLQASHSQSEV